MKIDGFVRKQLPPAPPEVVAAAERDPAEDAAKVVEFYLTGGIVAIAHLFKNGKGVVVQALRGMREH